MHRFQTEHGAQTPWNIGILTALRSVLLPWRGRRAVLKIADQPHARENLFQDLAPRGATLVSLLIGCIRVIPARHSQPPFPRIRSSPWRACPHLTPCSAFFLRLSCSWDSAAVFFFLARAPGTAA